MLKIPYGISDYKSLKEEGYYYVDKTMYLEKIENVGKTLVYLRPGRFGKTLFTSMMTYYYDVNSEDKFNTLFKDTYVYDNPTKNKNNYYILNFDFSGILSSGEERRELEREFKNNILRGIELFNKNYKTNIEVDFSNSPNGMLSEFLSKFNSLDLNHKLYIIIDEYDNFTNAILEGQGNIFREIVGNNGFVKEFYAVIKKYCSIGVVDRVFMTGICPITLDSMTTGFNISTDISTDVRFNEMIGLTHKEVKHLIKDIDEDKQDEIFDLMLKNYDGYLFSGDSDICIFNATLVMYFLNKYYDFNEVPKQLMDTNIAFNYGKIKKLLKLQGNSYYKEVIDTILKTGTINGELKFKFNLESKFKRDDIISLLYYFGYLTIDKCDIYDNSIIFRMPNRVISELYYNYFEEILSDINVNIDNSIIGSSVREMAETGRIDILTNYVSEILKKSDNRIFMKFDEKYIQTIYFALLISNRLFNSYNEYQCSNGYIDLMLFRNSELCKYDIMIELKYIKVKDYRKNRKLLNIKKEEAIEQLKSYSEDDRIDKTSLKRYAIVFVGHNLKVMEEV